MRRAAAWARDNRSRALQIIARELGDAEEWVEIAYGEDLFTSLKPSLSTVVVDALENQKDFLLRHGFIEHNFDVGEWAAPELYD